MNKSIEGKHKATSTNPNLLAQMTLSRPASSMLSLCIFVGMIVTLPCFSQITESSAVSLKPIGTVLTPKSKHLPIPSHNVELISTDGEKITVTLLGFGSGVKIQTADGRSHVVAWNRLSWESVAKLTGQELSYTKAGMDAQWLQASPARCSRSR